MYTQHTPLIREGMDILKSIRAHREEENNHLKAVLWIRKYFFRIRIRIPELGIRIQKVNLNTDPAESGSYPDILWPIKKICCQMGSTVPLSLKF